MCLDLFLEDCIRNKEKHDMLIKKKNKSGKIISFIALIGFVSIVLCMFFNPNLAISFFLLVFGVIAFSIIGSAFMGHKTEKLEQEIYSGGDGIDYSNIDNFLSSNQMHRFDDLCSETTTAAPLTAAPEDFATERFHHQPKQFS